MRLEEELLASWQVRKTKKQKEAFCAFVLQRCGDAGVPAAVEKKGRMRNIVIGDVQNARVLFTAHYDTCAVMLLPNFITPLNVVMYLFYSFALCALMMAAAALLGAGVSLLTDGALYAGLAALAFLWAQIFLMLLGPANRHTANDNTSGVALVLRLALCLPPKLRQNAAFVLFDGEELGLWGSSAFAARHKRAAREALCINFDCIGDGDAIFLCAKRGAYADARYALWRDCVRGACAAHGKQTLAPRPGRAFYPSDQANFKRGVGVAALRHSHLCGWYMDKIHTRRDRVLDRVNQDALFEAASVFLTDEELRGAEPVHQDVCRERAALDSSGQSV